MFIIDTYKVNTVNEVRPEDFFFLNFSGRNLYHAEGYLGQNIIVAVLDTGVSPHEELEDRLLPGVTFCKGYDGWPSAKDDHGHGTHVAGTIAGKTCGIAPKAKILPIKVMNFMGEGQSIDVLNGLDHILNWKGPKGETVDIVNMSISASQTYYSKYPDQLKAYHTAIQKLVKAGIAVIVAAGNTGKEEVRYPAFFPEVITVGAVDKRKNAALFSTRSKEVDLCQIGVEVISCDFRGGYVAFSGTSMATPIVSGIAALILSKDRAVMNVDAPKELQEIYLYRALKNNTVDVGIKGIDIQTGAGFCCLNPHPVHVEMKQNDPNYTVNGKRYKWDVPPNAVRGRTLIEIRGYVENTGGWVGWNPNTKIVEADV